jgi:hypothetical protein
MPTSPDNRTSRRALSRSVRDAFPPMGVFAIRNVASGRVRVKTSRNVPAAVDRIRFELRLGSHPDKVLQAEWDLLGAEAIVFEVLQLVKQREDTSFDYAGELRLLETLYRAELQQGEAA